jgi:hypothetical protein
MFVRKVAASMKLRKLLRFTADAFTGSLGVKKDSRRGKATARSKLE